jgi:hypothetical protein
MKWSFDAKIDDRVGRTFLTPTTPPSLRQQRVYKIKLPQDHRLILSRSEKTRQILLIPQ